MKAEIFGQPIYRHQGLFQAFDLLELAFGGLDVLFAVPSPLLLHNALDALDLALGIFKVTDGNFAVLRLFVDIIAVVAAVNRQFAVFQFKGFGCHAVEKIAVVGDDDVGAAK